MDSSSPQPPREVLDRRFALEVEHKRGGMGTVWRARDLATDRPVAVKILLDGGDGQAERFLREGLLLADLRHPAVVAYVGHGSTAAGVPYLAMEWLEGETVAERLARKPLTLRESLTLVRASLAGLAAAHRRGVVHRDLKPSNLFLRQGRLDDVVLLDLGLARFAGGARDLTRTGSVLGTPSYMAPEQAQGLAELGPAVDVFALGAVLFECLTGAPPFLGTHVLAVLAKLLFEPAPRLRELRPEASPELEALLERMLDKQPARRPADADAVAALLDALDPTLDAPAPSLAVGSGVGSLAPAGGQEQELVSVIIADLELEPLPRSGIATLRGASGAEAGAPPGSAAAASSGSASATSLTARAGAGAPAAISLSAAIGSAAGTALEANIEATPRVHLGAAAGSAAPARILLSAAAASAPSPSPLAAPAADLSAEAAAHGGELKRLGDGSMIITLGQRGGAATDLATRAARCALALAARHPAGRFAVAIGRGIAEGRVHIGEAVDRAGELLRRRSGAGTAGIWLDGLTSGLLDSRFRTAEVPGEEAVRALEGEDPSVDPERLLRGRPTTCVGREHELGMLELAWRACQDGAGPRALLVLGAPGIGKSRLRHELLRRLGAGQREVTCLLGLGDPIRTAGARSVLGGALARLCGLRLSGGGRGSQASPAPSALATAASPAAGAAPTDRVRLEERLGRHLGRLAPRERLRTVAFLGELCGHSFPAEAVSELRGAQQNPGILADLVRQAWLTFLAAEAAAGPVLLVLDDLQWSDAVTVGLVDAALRALTGAPILVLALGRPETLERFPGLWAPGLATLPLGPLPSVAQRRLVRQALGGELSDASVERLVAQSGGNALYLEELIRAADDRHQAVPETVMAMLQARIGLLPAPLRRLLRAASVFGESFSLAGLAALARGWSSPADLGDSLAVLARHEIVERQADDPAQVRSAGAPPTPGAGDPRWRFRHALMRDAAYALLTPEDAQGAHALAAEFLAREGEDPAVVAEHRERAGQLASAVALYTGAAGQAYRRNDFAAVRTLVERALACGAAGEERGVVRTIEAPARFYGGEAQASWAAINEALALLPPGHPRRLQALAAYKFFGGQLGKSSEVEPEMDELLAARPGEAERGSYVRSLGFVTAAHLLVGRRAPAQRILARIGEVADAAAEREHFAHGHACFWRVRYHAALGDDHHAAVEVARRGIACFERSGDRRMLALMQAEAGELVRRLSSVAEGLALLRPAVALAVEVGEPVAASYAMQYLATLLAEHGSDPEQAEARTLAEASIAHAGLAPPYRAFGRMALAQTATRTGELDLAEQEAREARSVMATVGMRGFYPHGAMVLGRVLVARGDAQTAARLATEAVRELAQLGPGGLIEIPVLGWAARVQLDAGQEAQAAALAAQAAGRLRERAARAPDREARRRFLADVPEHVALRALLRTLCPSQPDPLDETTPPAG